MTIGKRMRAILDILQDGEEDGETWTDGELWNDAGMWSASSVAAASDGARYCIRCQADPARRLHAQGFVMYDRTEVGAGEFGADRVVFKLTDKGVKA